MAKHEKKQEYPKMLYCTQQDDGDGPYILANGKPKDVAVAGEEIPVAVYQFVGMFTVNAPVSLEGAVVAQISMDPKTKRYRPEKG